MLSGERSGFTCSRRAFLILLAALALAGCGDSNRTGTSSRGSEPPQSLPGVASQVLTRAEVNSYPRNSPPRALLAWWRSAQYADLTGYLAGFQPSVKRQLQRSSKTPSALTWFAGLIRTVRPDIQSVEGQGHTATIYAELRYRTPVGTRRYITSTAPQAFALVRRAGTWLLRDDSFVQSHVPRSLQHGS